MISTVGGGTIGFTGVQFGCGSGSTLGTDGTVEGNGMNVVCGRACG
jgi:hypothetical protein